MKTHRITGGGRVQLHVVEAGNPRGRPILFLHGASQCSLQWSREMDSSLAERHRLVGMDLRGHGLSDRPRDAYGDSRLWGARRRCRSSRPTSSPSSHSSSPRTSRLASAGSTACHAQVQVLADSGHVAFWDDAAAFNERLHAFCEGL